MAGRLGEFLDRAMRSPFIWGTFDCVLWQADWSREIGAGDPGEPWRKTYSTPLGAARIIRSAGDLIGLIEREFSPHGWARSEEAPRGVIGIVRGRTEHGEAEGGAISLGNGKWAALTTTGLLIGPFPALAMWEHECLTSSHR